MFPVKWRHPETAILPHCSNPVMIYDLSLENFRGDCQPQWRSPHASWWADTWGCYQGLGWAFGLHQERTPTHRDSLGTGPKVSVSLSTRPLRITKDHIHVNTLIGISPPSSTCWSLPILRNSPHHTSHPKPPLISTPPSLLQNWKFLKVGLIAIIM